MEIIIHRVNKIKELKKISTNFGADNCDSLGSKWNGKYLTDHAIAASCSFYPAHHICTGEGGMVSSDDEELIRIARTLAWWGRDCYCVGAQNKLSDGTCGKRFDKWIEKIVKAVKTTGAIVSGPIPQIGRAHV